MLETLSIYPKTNNQ